MDVDVVPSVLVDAPSDGRAKTRFRRLRGALPAVLIFLAIAFASVLANWMHYGAPDHGEAPHRTSLPAP